jgi:hypothetical protein
MASVEFNGHKITDKLDLLVQVQLPWIATLTLNGKRVRDVSLANQVQDDLRDHMFKTFSHVGRETTKFIVKKSTKKDLETIIKHKDRADKGTPPSEYLKPQIVGGPVKRTRFQKALAERTGRMKRDHYMLPIKNDAPAWGVMKPGEYTRALWGIQAMESFRGTESYIGKRNYRSAGTYIQVPLNYAQHMEFDPLVKKRGDFIKALNRKGGKGFNLPPAGIYKVKKNGLEQVFQELEYLPMNRAGHYMFEYKARMSVSTNFKRIFDLKVKEVIG